MVHVIYDVAATGRFPPAQFGGIPYFEGIRYQRGFGVYRTQVGHGVLTRFLTRAWRYLVPLAKTHILPVASAAAKAIATEGAKAGANVLDEVAEGRNVSEALKTEAPLVARRLAKRASTHLKQKGGKRKPKRSLNNLHFVGRSVLESTAKKRRQAQTKGIY